MEFIIFVMLIICCVCCICSSILGYFYAAYDPDFNGTWLARAGESLYVIYKIQKSPTYGYSINIRQSSSINPADWTDDKVSANIYIDSNPANTKRNQDVTIVLQASNLQILNKAGLATMIISKADEKTLIVTESGKEPYKLIKVPVPSTLGIITTPTTQTPPKTT